MRRKSRFWVILCVIILTAFLAAGPVLGQSTISLVVDGRTIACDVSPQNVGGRVLVPIRAVAEALGCQVSYDAGARQVQVSAGVGGGSAAAGGGLAGLFNASGLFKTAAPSVVAVLCYTNNAQTGEKEIQGWGSGFVAKQLAQEAWILTNAHVVEGVDLVKVIFPDGKVFDVTPANIRADDVETSDVALIKVAVTGLTPLPLGDSAQVAVGDPAVAIGNPAQLQLRNTCTVGIISGVGRGFGQSYYTFLQTDAAINPGNSGGPLLNAKGQVIGITSLKFVDERLEGLAFAIPINTVVEIAVELNDHGMVSRPWLGLVVQESLEAAYGLPTDEGLYVAAVTPGGPAAAAGVQVGDSIAAVDGRHTHSVQDLSDALMEHKVGEKVILTLQRASTTTTLQVTLGERPAG
jgi:serine protease Do